MTDKQKKQIEEYRNAGCGYTQISKKMDLSINSIKTYCKRHGLGGAFGSSAPADNSRRCCDNCGKEVKQLPGRKLKRFCSDKCRMTWWNHHQENVNRKANYDFTCAYCGKAFTAYGNANRKYCSHECYIEDRFGGVSL